MKDWLLAKGLKGFLSGHIERYGVVNDVAIDSDEKSITITIVAHGDDSETEIKIEKYSIGKKDGKRYIKIEKATSSRLWISNLMEDFLKNKQFDIPNIAGIFL